MEWKLGGPPAGDLRRSAQFFPSTSIQPGTSAFRWSARLWWLCAGVLAVTLALPFLLIDVPPVLDYPNHLARYVALAHADDPLLSRIYAPNWVVLPNLGMDVLATALLKVLDAHVGGRLLLALSLVAPVIGVIIYSCAAFGRLTIWSLASGVIAYNGIFILGFMNFLLSLGLAFAAAGGWIVLRRHGYIWLAMLAGAAAIAVVFFCHIFGVALAALLIGAYELDALAQAWRQRTLTRAALLRACAMMIAVVSPAVVLYLASPLANGDAGIGPWGGVRKLWDLMVPFMSYSKTLTLTTAVAIFTLMVLTWRSVRFAPGVPVAFAVLAITFVLVPAALKGGTFVGERLALMMGLLLFAGVRLELAPRYRHALALAVVALIAVRVGYVGVVWADHRHDLADLRAAIAPVGPGTRVLAARGHTFQVSEDAPADRVLPGVGWLHSHMPALLTIERRAFWPLMFADPAQQPLTVRQPYGQLAHPLEDPVHWPMLSEQPPSRQSLLFAQYLTNWRSAFDYVLLIAPPENPIAPAGLERVYAGSFAVLYRIAR